MSSEIVDNMQSLLTGLGDPNVDKAASLIYMDRALSDQQLQAAYRNTWIARKVVDIPALDAFRKWRSWQASQEQITAIEELEKRFGVQQKMLNAAKLGRLWGGSALYIGIKGQSPSSPLDVETVTKDSLQYLTVIPRREIVAGELEDDVTSEWYGRPKVYQMTNGTNWADIHPSRVVVQLGNPLPDPWIATGTSQGWSDSVLQAVWTATQNADSSTANIASLLFEANVDVFGIPDLMEKIATQEYRSRLTERLVMANIGKGITKALMRDKDEEYVRNTINFSGLPDLLQQFLIIVAGAADIPLTRFLGQSASGLSSTGEHDMKNYYDRVASIQALEVSPAMQRLDEVLIRSALGSRPKEIFTTWNPLEQMSEKELAEIGKMNAETATSLVTSALFMPEELRECVGNQLVESGFYPGLGDLLKKNGPDLPEFDLARQQEEAALKTAQEGSPDAKLKVEAAAKAPKKPTGDADPRTLYVRRDVLNGQEIADWYKGQGVDGVYEPSSMHVTIVYSKKPVDWMKVGQAWTSRLELPEGGPRLMDKFGDDQSVLVLLFKSHELDWRHEQAKEAGASYDHGEYQSHISISLEGRTADLATLKPWQGEIRLGPEVFEEIDLDVDWRSKVKVGDEV